MRHPTWLLTPVVFGVFALTSCGDQPTQPTTPTDQPGIASAALASDSWIIRRDMPLERQGVVSATVPNAAGQSILYVIGGFHPYRPYPNLARVDAYNVATDTWSRKRDLPIALSRINGAGVIRGKIYVAGGRKLRGWGPTAYALLVYDPATDTWAQKRAMPARGAGGVTGVIEDRLYVAVPSEEQPDQSNFFRYDPVTNRWTTLTSPRHAYFMGGVLFGKLYLVGNEVEAYDPASNQWTAAASPPAGEINIWGTAGAAWARLYVFGGARTLVYAPLTDTWTARTPGAGPAQLYGSRVFLDGKPRFELVGGTQNWQYVP